MKPGQKRFNVFDRIKSVKELLAPISQDSFTIRGLVLRCVKFRVGQAKKLNGTEAKTYDLLLKNGYHPKRVYEWLLLEDAPPHIREKLEQKKISIENARAQCIQWKKFSGSRLATELMEEMRNTIRRLRWKSQEGLEIQL